MYLTTQDFAPEAGFGVNIPFDTLLGGHNH
jgi:hypothetical protein